MKHGHLGREHAYFCCNNAGGCLSWHKGPPGSAEPQLGWCENRAQRVVFQPFCCPPPEMFQTAFLSWLFLRAFLTVCLPYNSYLTTRRCHGISHDPPYVYEHKSYTQSICHTICLTSTVPFIKGACHDSDLCVRHYS